MNNYHRLKEAKIEIVEDDWNYELLFTPRPEPFSNTVPLRQLHSPTRRCELTFQMFVLVQTFFPLSFVSFQRRIRSSAKFPQFFKPYKPGTYCRGGSKNNGPFSRTFLRIRSCRSRAEFSQVGTCICERVPAREFLFVTARVFPTRRCLI